MDILHPLHEIVDYREIEDRLQIKVSPDANKKELLSKIQTSIDTNLVMNADIAEIRKALLASSGEFVDVGPALEKYREESDEQIILKTSELRCTLTVKEDILDLGIKPTVNLIKTRLKRAGITFGIIDSEIEMIVDKQLWENPIVVAQGVESVRGKNGSIEYKVSTEAVFTPTIGEDGTADFRDIQSFTQVKAGDLIAVRIPEEKGTPGTSIFGSALPAEPGLPYELKPSNNIIVSADQNELRAESAGILIKTDGVLSIKNDLEIAGDVDFKVGNISFAGKVIINGNVLPGFTIESESDILIHGQVESATITSTGGSVQIEKGVIGKDNTIITAKNQLIINFAQDAVLHSEGTVTVETSLLRCSVICEELKTISPKATIIGGKITAFKSISIASSGNEEESLTELVIMDKTVVELIEKRKKLAEVLEQLNHLYVPAEREVRNKTSMIKKAGQYATDEHRQSLEQSTKRFATIKMKTELVEKNIATIDTELKRDDILEGDISITGEIYAGTHLEVHKKRQTFKRPDHSLHFALKDGELSATPIK